MDDHHLTELISLFKQLPEPVLDRIIIQFETEHDTLQLINSIQTGFGSSASINRLIRLLDTDQLDPRDMALVFRSLQIDRKLATQKEISLVWSGPNVTGVPLRMTAQVIMEMIDQAQESLFLSSFTFYKVKEIIKRLEKAAQRGVEISLLLETPQSSQYKVKIDPLRTLSDDLKSKLNLYIWPYRNRVIEGDPNTGTLHAKFILQDQTRLFVSSANLTQSAMDRNIELGVIIEDTVVIQKMRDHLDTLIRENVITRV